MVGLGIKGRLAQIGGNGLLLVGVFLTVMPFFYMVSASFKEGSEIFSIPIKLLPQGLYLGNYEILFEKTP